MKNPWKKIIFPSAYSSNHNYILPADKLHIRAFNNHLNGNKKYEIRTNLLPVPYSGKLNASILILLLNPGYSKNVDEKFYKDKTAYSSAIAKLSFKDKYPFYLDDHFHKQKGGPSWWYKVFKNLLEEENINQKSIQSHFWVMEFFPYHSKSYKLFPFTLSSQNYNFYLLRRFIKDNSKGRIVLIARGEANWFTAVPELKNFDNCFTTKNPRRTSITKKMFGDPAYKKIIKILKTKDNSEK